MTDAPTPRRAGGRRLTGTTGTRRAALAAATSLCVLFAVGGGAAYGQTRTDAAPAQTTPAQTTTETTPTETTPTTTETTPPPETTDPTSAPNEYVESVPTGGGSAPASQNPAPAPAAPATPTDGVTQSTQPTGGTDETSTPKAHRKIRRSADLGDPVHVTATPHAQAPRSVPVTPTSADPGEPPSPFLLGIALLLITGVVLSTAVARRHSAGT
jgi:hypothetical protein